MKRRFFFIIIAMLGFIYYTTGKPSEISDRVMIHAVGVDPSDEGYKVTMQVFSPEGSGGETALDPSMPNVSLVKGEGSTVSKAVQQCMLKLGGDVFLGQNRIIIFGRDVDLSKKDELFSYFLLSSEAFLNVNCAAAEDTAEKLLELPLSGNSIASEKFPSLIQSGEKAGTCAACTFTELLDSMDCAEQTVILPVISIVKKQKKAPSSDDSSSEEKLEDDSPIAIQNGALYVGGKYKTDISCEQMGLAAAINGTGHYVRIDSGDETKVSRTFRIRTREVSADMTDDGIVIKISCRTSPSDPQLNTSPLSRIDENQKTAALIGDKAQELCDELCQNHSAELIGADKYLKRFYPKLFLKYKDNPEELYSHVSFEVYFE